MCSELGKHELRRAVKWETVKGMASGKYLVYYESKSGTNKRRFARKSKALAVAARASRLTQGGYVTISVGYREIAECHRGTCRLV